ncbi:adenosylmethionine decarboxylase, partial [Alishewanella sp. SMS9]|nr:adenosylmethionine decarboxylase [Alishewanella sp. SMS9]
ICVHTYPEVHPHGGICTFRADIEVSTCGIISPLKALNYLIHSFESDVVTIDYRVRGFTRDISGTKHYIDHPITSIQNFMDYDTKKAFQMIDVNVYQENLFHTKMMLKEGDLNNYLFGMGTDSMTADEQKDISSKVFREIREIFYGRNLPEVK